MQTPCTLVHAVSNACAGSPLMGQVPAGYPGLHLSTKALAMTVNGMKFSCVF